ncbi:GNAT family N-acetyltransferase [Viridibacillus sp. FSL R5-0477]|uniref:N-acetyltransferase GCN5 n=1 Tax=Viridibacillus arenosi FSL R5-213 TaxID=1227360 RepID=W4EXK6_9BACL|nr:MULTISPECIES: GNAT family N-acetyltransferase [Viridibacillus]ETT85270.1 N-acetyltransferase GCN5 [Viridibacillus arenosi FSL R5-213]OMC81009.1 N-acetyltransferase [Viridibacillus sp. FSL H8-0123]OMC89333.1 N-acetyltransferase [Viridibacillus arenosi]
MTYFIRPATNEDIAGIAKVHVDSWRTTYKGIVKQDYLDKLTYSSREASWKRNIESEQNLILVAVNEEEQIVGFISGSKTQEGEYPTYDADLTAIYLFEHEQGKGIGKAMLKQLFAEFKKLNYKSSIVKVLEDNSSCRFYEAMGAKFIDSNPIQIGGEQLAILTYGWQEI